MSLYIEGSSAAVENMGVRRTLKKNKKIMKKQTSATSKTSNKGKTGVHFSSKQFPWHNC